MKYCYNCNRITPGEPLFCNYCGRSYNVKLCPRQHPNPRSAEACSRCGSRDFSTPQPRVPWWVPCLELALSVIPGLFLAIASVVTVIVAVEAIRENPALQLAFLKLLIVLGVFWWIWSQLPVWFRTAVYKMLKRRREGHDRRGERPWH